MPLFFLANRSFEDRLHDITTLKPEEERERRLQLFKAFEGSVASLLPEAYKQMVRWSAAYEKWQHSTSMSAVRNAEFEDIWNKLHIELRSPEVLRLHAKQCGCGWTPENNNIFNYQP